MPSFRDTPKPRTRNPDALCGIAGFRVRRFAPPRNNDVRHRPYSLIGPGQAVVLMCASPKRTRARGTPRVQTDPRASTPRDIEACRSARLSVPQVRHLLGVPRAVFVRFAPLRPRWTVHFRRAASCNGRSIHRCGPRTGPASSDTRRPIAAVRGPATHGRCAGTKRLGPPGGEMRRISDAPIRPPLPAPRLKMLAQTPLVWGGINGYNPFRLITCQARRPTHFQARVPHLP